MDITYCKNQCFKIAVRTLTISINPEGELTKLKDLILLSTPKDSDKAEAIIFDSPGEYEVKGCMVDAIDLGELTGFVLTTESLRVAYLPLGVETLTDKQIEAYDSIDVLIVPVAEEKIEATNKLISQFEPKVVIPYGYTTQQFQALSTEFGGATQTVEKLKITSRDLDTDQQQLVELTPS